MVEYLSKFKLKNKNIIINGGLGLLGMEISIACLSAGANVVIIDIDKTKKNTFEKKARKFKNKYNLVNFDTSNYKTIEKNYKKLINKFYKIDVLINCSYPKDKNWINNSFDKINIKSFRTNIDLHMISYAWLAKLVADSMVKQNIGGSIINLGSIYGILGQDLSIYKNTNLKENMTYSIVKSGITNFTRQMASYYGKYKIRVNTLCPGGIVGHISGSEMKQDKTFVKNFSNKIPLGRLGKPNEIATCALFLASDASSYVTGSTLIVDGGWSSI